VQLALRELDLELKEGEKVECIRASTDRFKVGDIGTIKTPGSDSQQLLVKFDDRPADRPEPVGEFCLKRHSAETEVDSEKPLLTSSQ